MSEKDQSLEEKIASIVEELKRCLNQNVKDATLIDELINKLKSIGTWQVIEPVKEILEISNCPVAIQQKILDLLGKIQDPRVISILVSFLDHDNAKLRHTAIKSLSLIKNPKVSQFLITAAQEEDKWVKIFAIHGLTKNASLKVIPPLIQLLGDPEEEVRKEAMIALTKLKIENINDLLIEALNANERYIVLGAANLLGVKKVSKSVPALLSLIGNEDRRKNLIVCNTLSTLSSPDSLVPLLDYSIQERDINNQYMLCIQKMDASVLSSLIEIYLSDYLEKYSMHIEYLLKKSGLIAHELIMQRKASETNPEMQERLEKLEGKLEK